jgi:3-hydroxybutyryl-CoA dehydrogenase
LLRADLCFHCLAGFDMICAMPIDTIKTVAVLGAGTMGNGVAHVFARSGYRVILRDVEQRFLDRGLETISKNLDREVKKERITLVEKVETL